MGILGDEANPMTNALPNHLRRSDIKKIEQHARNRWPMPNAIREAAITRLAMIVADPKQRPRTHVAAVRALAELDKINVAKELHEERMEIELERARPSPMLVTFEGDPDAGLPKVHPAAEVIDSNRTDEGKRNLPPSLRRKINQMNKDDPSDLSMFRAGD